MIDVHLLAAAARLFGERGIDRALAHLGHTDHQRPINLLGAAPGEPLRKRGGAARRLGDQQHAGGILIEPMD